MENATLIIEMITSIGFPTVCCVFLWKYINNAMQEFTRTMSENTRMLSRIADRLSIHND